MSNATSAEEFRNMIKLKKKQRRQKRDEESKKRISELNRKANPTNKLEIGVNETTRKIIRKMRETSSFNRNKKYNATDINKLDNSNLLAAYEEALKSDNLVNKALIRTRIFKLVGEENGRRIRKI